MEFVRGKVLGSAVRHALALILTCSLAVGISLFSSPAQAQNLDALKDHVAVPGFVQQDKKLRRQARAVRKYENKLEKARIKLEELGSQFKSGVITATEEFKDSAQKRDFTDFALPPSSRAACALPVTTRNRYPGGGRSPETHHLPDLEPG